MFKKSIRVKGTASVANVSCGFDSIGYSLSEPGDVLTIETIQPKKIEIEITGAGSDSIPVDPEKNSAGKAVITMLSALKITQGFRIGIGKGIPPGSGIGSSAASAAAALFAVNALLDKPLSLEELIPFGMEGENVAAGTPHADNIAPALLGGMILIRSYNPLEILKLPVPNNLYYSVILPELKINTLDARKILPQSVKLSLAVGQAGNLAGFISGLFIEDFELMGRSMVDHFAEPYRMKLIPGYNQVRESAMNSGAIGCGISGSGPAMFALSDSMDKATSICTAMEKAFLDHKIKSASFCSNINTNPPEILD